MVVAYLPGLADAGIVMSIHTVAGSSDKPMRLDGLSGSLGSRSAETLIVPLSIGTGSRARGSVRDAPLRPVWRTNPARLASTGMPSTWYALYWLTSIAKFSDCN